MPTVHRLLLAVVLVLGVCGHARAQDGSCGGPWQAPCTYWDSCAWRFLGIWCVGDWVPTPPWNGCDSSRFNNWPLIGCVPCGGTGQGECWNEPKCDAWHNAFGLCYACGGASQPYCWNGLSCSVGLRNVFGFCSWAGFSPEPTTNVTGLPSLRQAGTGRDPVQGIADVHNHQFANLGFGGVVFWGEPYDARGINAALAWCDYTWDFGTPVWTPLGYEVHGPKALQWGSAPVSAFDREGIHDVGGTGPFDGWPKYNTMTHQQVYYKWLERAYQGGLRLMVMHAISSEAICRASKVRAGWTCDDMQAVDRQIQAAKDLEVAIDRMDDGVANGSGWYRIAYSPQQARQIIRDGKMAVVLGIEVDSLFGCKRTAAGCTADYVRGQLERYHSMGVRHLYPIHHYDNAFGGAAVFINMLNTGNALISGSHFTVRDCSAAEDGGYTFNVAFDAFAVLGLLLGVPLPNYAYYDQFAADCNALGLSALGEVVIDEMMDMKFILDVDHMSRLMLDRVLEMASARSPKYPLVSGHTNFLGRMTTSRYEMSLTDDQLATMKEIGGIVTVTTIPSDCGTSSEFLDKYEYALGKMTGGPYGAGYEGVALGTDFNGWGTQLRPRFGLEGCPSDDPASALTYPFTGLFGGSFGKQQTGQREFNLNTDGLAQAGLLADLFADVASLNNRRETPADLTALYNSAETYIQMWERIDDSDKLPPPTIEAHIEGTLSDSAWYTSDVTVTWDVTTLDPDNNPVTSRSAGCEPQTVTTDTAGLTISCTATTGSGASAMSTTKSVTIRRDTTPPVVTATSSVPPGAWSKLDITVHFSASDATSGMVGEPELDVVLGTEGGNQTVSHVFVDLAGNTAEASVSGLNVDRTPPQIRFAFADLPPDATDEEQLAQLPLWHNHDVRLVVEAIDPLSGVAVGSPAPALLVLSQEGSAAHGTATATDVAGNTATVASFDVKIDKTAPTITRTGRTPAANGYGWNNSDVTVTWACADALAGPAAETVATTVSGEGAGLSATGTCADLAGNTTSASESGIDIDRTPPVIQAAAAPPANGAGWNNTAVTVTFTATDALSGVDGDTVVDVPIATEGVDLFAARTFVDRAGNEASARLGGIRIDMTPPAITFGSRLPAPNAYGWNNTDVTVTWHCADALSGAIVPAVSQTATAEGLNASFTGTCGDVAGNAASATVSGINIDKTPPVVTCTAAPDLLWPANHQLVPIAVALGIDGGLSGAAGHVVADAASNEADDGLGDGDTAGDIVGFAPGGTALAGALRAERSGRGTGRIYSLGYRGFDRAGNSATCGTAVNVPRSQGSAPKR